MKIDGRCHCGYIRYEAQIDPEKVMICHCTDCQTLSGSAFRTVALTREGTFKLLSGELKIYVKTGENGAKRPQSFCPECGSARNAERRFIRPPLAKDRRSTPSVSARPANAINSCRKCSSGVAPRKVG